ncbi:MAG: AtpZ/AtpI family protein [Anaerolineae bacterium]
MKDRGQITGLATELGMTMGLTAAGLIFLGLWAGRQVDALLGTKPYATLMLLVAGVVIGQISIIRLAIRSRDYLNEHEEMTYAFGDAAGGFRVAGKALGLLALPAVLRLAGVWLDRMLGTSVVFSLLMVVLGLVIAVAGLLSIVESVRTSRGERDNP